MVTWEVVIMRLMGLRRKSASKRVREMRFTKSSVLADISEKYGAAGDLSVIFDQMDEVGVNKWHHYLPIYERTLACYRGSKVRFLEIGVARGGSLKMWREFLGADATIFGIDVNPRCSQFDGKYGQVRIGSQADESFLGEVVAEMGGVDVVLDDGSHVMEHLRKTFLFLFPRLADSGIYIAEDLHTAYWREFGGGIRAGESFFRFVDELIDDMHRWYHEHRQNYPGLSDNLSSIEIFDSLAILRKGPVFPPVHSLVGVDTL